MEACTRCDSPVHNVHHSTRDGKPLCASCAGVEPHANVFDMDSALAHEDSALKGQRPGEKEPFLELKAGDSLEHRTGLWRERFQRVDRDNDTYDKVVTDKETGAIIHECHEPLSKHRGRGSAKPKSK